MSYMVPSRFMHHSHIEPLVRAVKEAIVVL